MNNSLSPLESLRHLVSGKPVKECEVCHEAKDYGKFFKDASSGFRNYKGEPDDTGVSAICRACKLKEARIEKDIHLREIGWKR